MIRHSCGRWWFVGGKRALTSCALPSACSARDLGLAPAQQHHQQWHGRSIGTSSRRGPDNVKKRDDATPGLSRPGSAKAGGSTADAVRAMRERMSASNNDGCTEADKWESLWTDGLTPWDLGRPTPALVHELGLDPHHPLLEASGKSTPIGGAQQLRTLVPGCGAGYDLIPLFRHHDDLIASGIVRRACVVGLDLSPTSLARAVEEIEAALEFCPLERPTQVRLVRGDYFQDPSTWEVVATYGGSAGETGESDGSIADSSRTAAATAAAAAATAGVTSHFEFVYDYTFFCALPPSLRPAWGQRTAELLHPTRGRLLTLMFPVLGGGEDEGREEIPREPLRGPPYPVSPQDYRNALEPHGLAMEREPYECPATDPTRAGMELVCWWSQTNHRNVHPTPSKL